ncbi:MAG: response regulator transcription factor [Geodermatophilaceae bacterium]|nr:response regulator transcription factor [Geodermatophilaceae bacterium]
MAGVGDPVRVLLVDDDALVRSGLRLILGGAPDIQVVGEAADGDEAIALTRTLAPDVVLMDIRMPRRDGISTTSLITALLRPEPPRIIVLTTFDADDLVVRGVAAGASGFLLKDTPPALIVEAVRRVADGDPMLSPSVTAQLMRRIAAGAPAERATSAQARLAGLTERELEVAVAIGRGLSNAEIGAELYLSVATVKAHVSRLFSKLAVTNRVQIAIITHDAGLL